MISLFVRIAFVVALIVDRSFPVMSGAAMIAHMLKWARPSVSFRPLPTSNMSGSFQWPGPATMYSGLFLSISRITSAQLADISNLMGHMFGMLTSSIEQLVGVQ